MLLKKVFNVLDNSRAARHLFNVVFDKHIFQEKSLIIMGRKLNHHELSSLEKILTREIFVIQLAALTASRYYILLPSSFYQFAGISSEISNEIFNIRDHIPYVIQSCLYSNTDLSGL